MLPEPLDKLMQNFARLPGLGRRSAQRAVLHLLTDAHAMDDLRQLLESASTQISTCESCGNISTEQPCHICKDAKRDLKTLCILEGVADVWAMEKAQTYSGRYFILGGVMNMMTGMTADKLRIPQLVQRVKEEEIEEVILALSASVDGQSTAQYIAESLEDMNVNVTTLAKGIPMGAEVDYMDEGTLSLALKGRQKF